MSMSDFLVNIDGIDKTAHIVTRLEVTGTGVEYIYYNVDGEKDENGDLYLFTSRVKSNEDGTDEIIEIENEDEKKIAFEIFSKACSLVKLETSISLMLTPLIIVDLFDVIKAKIVENNKNKRTIIIKAIERMIAVL